MTEIGTPRDSSPAHVHYDHASVEGDPSSELRDRLVVLGFDAVVAHTGGGCMSVEVPISKRGEGAIRYVLVGVDTPLSQPAPDGGFSGGADVYSWNEDDDYVGSKNFDAPTADAIVEQIVEWLRDPKVEIPA